MDENQSIALAGDGSVAAIIAHHQVLQTRFRVPGAIAVDVSQINSADASFVQLVVVAARMAARQARSFSLQAVPEALRATLAGAGVALDPSSGHIVAD